MTRTTLAHGFFALCLSTCGSAWAATSVPSTDPLAAIDLNRNAIIADIVQGFEGDRVSLTKRLEGLRADRLLSASLASTRESLDLILSEAERSRDAGVSRAGAKVLGSAAADLVYTPLTPCRLIDTRGFGAPIQGGAFAPNARRSYVPNGLCALPTTGVATILISFTTQNLTPNSGGYLAILAPAAPVTASVDVFNLGSEWSASNTAVNTGSAAQFDVLVAVANAHVVIDVLGYFAPPQGGAVTSITAGTGLTGGTISNTGTIALAPAFQLPQACTNGQVAQSNGAGGWTCVTLAGSGGTVTGVTASAPLASSGGNAPDISLNGSIPVANGGTGQATLPANGVVYGQGTAAVGTVVGGAGQVLAGTAGAPAWTGSPSISGNLSLVDSTATTGNIIKGGSRFIHTVRSGAASTFVGQGAGNFSMTASGNTGMGAFTLISNTTGGNNTASGASALLSNTTGNFNTANGANALLRNTTGDDNTAVGQAALQNNTTGIGNTATGKDALQNNTTGIGNTATGKGALQNNTTANFNTASGSGALQNNTAGSENTAIGFTALFLNTTGTSNTASGSGALLNNTTGNYNTANGWNALYSNTTGDENTANGYSTLINNGTGISNTASGFRVLQNNSTGYRNTASGTSALFGNTTGGNNTAIGSNALLNNTTGDFNIAVGANAGVGLTTGNSNINIGSSGAATEDNTIRIGSAQDRAFIAGIRNVTTGNADAVAVMIDSYGQLGTVSSSRRVKDDIADMDAASAALMRLRPVTFHYKADRNPSRRSLQYGLIAEEVAEVYPGLVAHSANGEVETVMYQYLPSMLLNEMQKQQRMIHAQAEEIAALKQQSARMAAALERLSPANVAAH